MSYERDVVALQEAKGIGKNLSFLLLFSIAGLVTLVGLLVIGISGVAGWILSAVMGVLGGAAAATGRAETMMTLGVAVIAALSGIASVIVAALNLAGVH